MTQVTYAIGKYIIVNKRESERHTFWMITVLLHVTVNFHKLFENGSIATGAFVGESNAVVKVAIH